MPALQTFSELFTELFTELQADVDRLTKQGADLRQENVILEAKNDFLVNATKQLESQRLQQKADYDAAAQRLNIQLQAMRDDITTARKEYDQLQADHKAVEAGLQAMKDHSDEEVMKLTKTTTSIKADIAKLLQDKRLAEVQLADVTEEIRASKQAAKVLDDQLPQKAAEVKAGISELEADMTVVTDRYQALTSQLDDKQDELETQTATLDRQRAESAALSTKDAEFKQYEQRARAALEAREAALLQGEELLKDATMRAQRRGIILDNL